MPSPAPWSLPARSWILLPVALAGLCAAAPMLATGRAGPVAAGLLALGGIVCAGAAVLVAEYLADRRAEVATRAEQAAREHATRDPLTGLLTRAAFMARLGQGSGERLDGSHPDAADERALFLLDLDRFKAINDDHGHAVGDAVLAHVGRVMRAVLEGEAAGRLGGDEFAFMLPGSASQQACLRIATRLLQALERPAKLGGRMMQIRASIGVAWLPEHGRNPDELMHRADMALYRAKAQGRGTAACFEPAMLLAETRRTALADGLRRALRNGTGLSVHYQPLCNAAGRVAAVEALLRWTDPLLGPVSPGEFIPVAEEAGLIAELGRLVLRHALADALPWEGVTLNVNVSPVQLRSGQFADEVGELLAEAGFPAGRLMLEITEGVLLDCGAERIGELETLRRMGVGLSLDDFGSGYSSLSYLKTVPLDQLKIDRSYIATLGEDARSRVLVASIVGLARGLDLRVVAEGIETEEQMVLLRAVGCTLYQGFLLGRPMPAAAIGTQLAGQDSCLVLLD